MPITAALIGGGLNMVMGSKAAADKGRADAANLKANAEAIRYSPWTKMNAEMKDVSANNPAMAGLAGGAQGAMAGYQFGKSNPDLFGGKAAPEAPFSAAGKAQLTPEEMAQMQAQGQTLNFK